MVLFALSVTPAFAADGVANTVAAEPQVPIELKGVGIRDKLGQMVSIDAFKFQNENGETVALSQYFDGKRPVLVSLIYYQCPTLCSLTLNGLTDTLKGLDWTAGNQFELVSVSIDPREKADIATRKKAGYISAYGRPDAAKGWHFLTAANPVRTTAAATQAQPTEIKATDETDVKRLADQLGFDYRWDEASQQFAHAAALFVLTPEGKLSRVLNGIQWEPRDLRFALLEASNGRIGTVVDRLLLFCYRYDPISRKYSMYLTNVMQAAAAATILVIGSYLTWFWRRQRKLAHGPVLRGAQGG